MIRPFLLALQFLTRLPVRLHGELSGPELGRSLLCYPLVGLLLGALLAALGWLLSDVPALLGAALLLLVWVAVTGALHLDGLADSVDAWVGGLGDRQRTLDIMKDPRSGPMAVAAVVVVLLLKFSALAALCEAGNWTGLVYAPLLGRAALPLLFLTTAYVRAGGLGSALAEHLPAGPAWAVSALTALAVLLAAGAAGLWLLLVAGLTLLLLRAAMQARIGGMTGDTAGALLEGVETAVLVAVVLVF